MQCVVQHYMHLRACMMSQCRPAYTVSLLFTVMLYIILYHSEVFISGPF